MKRNAACLTCQHLSLSDLKEQGVYRCGAFYEIPEEVISGENQHEEYIEGQISPILYSEINSLAYPNFADTNGYYKAMSPCSSCAHFNRGECEAFDKIPLSIVKITGHKQPLLGQNTNDICYKKKS